MLDPQLIFQHPTLIFLTISLLLSVISFTPTPSFVPVVLTLSTLQLYVPIFSRRPKAPLHGFLLLFVLGLGGLIARLTPSLHALSSPGVSLTLLFFLTTAISFFALAAVFLDTWFSLRLPAVWSQITFFPAIWALLWWVVSHNPVGRLATLSPVLGMEPYRWMIQWVGPVGLDWIVGAWATVCSQAIGAWAMGPPPAQDVESLLPEVSENGNVPKRAGVSSNLRVLPLATLLVALTLPSFIFDDFPLPVLSEGSTPLSVGCVLPSFQRYKHHVPTLDDFIAESQKMTSSANILLWPEGAVTFWNESQRDIALERVRTTITGSHVGVSFEELVSDPSDSSGRSSLRRTGIAVVSHSSPEIHLLYYKRNLVPIAESYHLTHSTAPPTIYTLNLTAPKGTKKADWAPAPDYKRPIPLTASICLDFASPSVFAELKSRPALILAPARTWHTSVGYAMWQQAKQRANEIDSLVLWCDGGEGGVSGIAGGSLDEVMQVGHGSWVRTVGIQWPFDERQTVYARSGSTSILLLAFLLVFGSSVVKLQVDWLVRCRGVRVIRVAEIAFQRWKEGRGQVRPENDADPDLL